MSRARNNFSRLPYEIRRLVMRLLLDGAEYDEIRRTPEVARALAERGLALHGSTFLAIRRSAEFAEYKAARSEAENRSARDRRAAEALRDCAGIASVADMTQMMLLEQLRDLAAAGGDPAELLRLTNAVTRIKAADSSDRIGRLTRQLDEAERRFEAAEREHAAREAELLAKIAELESALPERTIDGSQVADALNSELGL